jgi:hypothetical protein
MKRTFQHKFKGGVTATMVMDTEIPKESAQAFSCEWSGQPKKEDLPEYMGWVQSINEQIAAETGQKRMHVFQLPGGIIEPWIYEPHQPARKLDHDRSH